MAVLDFVCTTQGSYEVEAIGGLQRVDFIVSKKFTTQNTIDNELIRTAVKRSREVPYLYEYVGFSFEKSLNFPLDIPTDYTLSIWRRITLLEGNESGEPESTTETRTINLGLLNPPPDYDGDDNYYCRQWTYLAEVPSSQDEDSFFPTNSRIQQQVSGEIPFFYDEERLYRYLQGYDEEPDGYTSEEDEEGQDPSADPNDPFSDPTNLEYSNQNPLAIKNMVNYYLIDAEETKDIMEWFWWDMFEGDGILDQLKAAVTHLYDNLNQCVTGCRIFPFELKNFLGYEQKGVYIGRYTAPFTLYKVDDYLTIAGEKGCLHCGEKYIGSMFGNFLDYKCHYQMNIPFVGIRELPPQLVVGKTIGLSYIFDITTGGGVAVIRSDNKIIMEIECNLSVEIPITSDNMMQSIMQAKATFFRGLAGAYSSASSASMGGAVSALTAGVGGVANAGFEAAGQIQAIPYSTGSPTPMSNFLNVLTPYIIITKPNAKKESEFKKEKAYRAAFGRPSYRAFSEKMKGFTQFYNPVIDYSKGGAGEPKPTSEENEMLVKLLSEGIYF